MSRTSIIGAVSNSVPALQEATAIVATAIAFDFGAVPNSTPVSAGVSH